METSNKVRRVSVSQVETLCEFLNSNRDIATAHNRSLQAKDYAQKKWTEITAVLNSHEYGANKDWRGWSKYWVDYKAKLKSKVAALRASCTQNGGPSTEKALTEIEEKFLQVVGEDFGHEILCYKVETFVKHTDNDNNTTEMEVQDSPASESVLQPSVQIEHPYYVPNFIRIPEPPPLEPKPAPVSHSTPIPLASPSGSSPSATAHIPRRRRRKREPPMSQEDARRALVLVAKRHADAAERSSRELAKMVEIMEQIHNSAARIERTLNAAFPTAAEPENS